MGYPHIFKKCGDCGLSKPVGDFYKNPKGTQGRDGYCKECRRTRDQARAAGRNKEVAAKLAKDPHHYRRKKLVALYGITIDQYDAMFCAQGGKCAICRMPESRVLYGKTAHLVVDHNHDTGKVRSLLCHRCNTALAAIEDAGFRAAALNYLEAHQ